jgi:hypothetical protein
VSNPKIPVLGAGGIGGYFGGRLVESGADVTFLVREGGAKSSPSRGCRSRARPGDAKLAVKTVVGQHLAPAFAWSLNLSTRIGFEEGVHQPNGIVAADNADLVRTAIQLRG